MKIVKRLHMAATKDRYMSSSFLHTTTNTWNSDKAIPRDKTTEGDKHRSHFGRLFL